MESLVREGETCFYSDDEMDWVIGPSSSKPGDVIKYGLKTVRLQKHPDGTLRWKRKRARKIED